MSVYWYILFLQLHHYLHHHLKHGNFGGLPMGYLDRLFGTELEAYQSFRLEAAVKPTRSTRAWHVRGLLCGLACLLCVTRLLSGWVTLGILLFVWIGLVDGVLVIPPPRHVYKNKQKVFGIGLSRTGTTSLTHALNQLGLPSYHFSRHLVSFPGTASSPVSYNLNAQAVESFAGFTDISVCLVFPELAEAFPEAVFIYTTRDPVEWGQAMHAFVSSPVQRALFRAHPVADRFFSLLYGSDWPNLGPERYTNFYRAYDRKVREFFARNPARLLELPVRADHEDKWTLLTEFLADKEESNTEQEGAGGTRWEGIESTPFPHRYVFHYSMWTQPLTQLSHLSQRLGCWRLLSTALLVLALLGTWLGPQGLEYGQCARACRTEGFQDGQLSDGWLFGDWCECSPGSVAVSRYHPSENWTWPYTTAQVCASDGAEYPNAAEAQRAGVEVLNCGLCGKCSDEAAIAQYQALDVDLTPRATKCAILGLVFGSWASTRCVEDYMGLPEACATCWVSKAICHLTHAYLDDILLLFLLN